MKILALIVTGAIIENAGRVLQNFAFSDQFVAVRYEFLDDNSDKKRSSS